MRTIEGERENKKNQPFCLKVLSFTILFLNCNKCIIYIDVRMLREMAQISMKWKKPLDFNYNKMR